ncbi:MAG: sugar ABC transporter permease YjfF, partial [Chlorobia bacterium]|nr:sugar ABC transporter permease YjfF [Fimbriimonadaceae bacterium]
MKALLAPERRPIMATAVVCLLLYSVAGFYLRENNFVTFRVFFNFFSDNAFLGVIALGLTLVIITGGIDLSVGSMAGCASIMAASLITNRGIHPLLAFGIVCLFGATVGLIQGFLIARYQLAPFLITLGGLFFCRGVGLLISREATSITNPLVQKLGSPAINVLGGPIFWPAFIFIVLAVVMAFVLRQTRFGRTLFAIGGNAPSAHLMGLPVNRSLTLAYALSGAFAAIGGIHTAIYTGSGNATAGTGLELDA